MFHFAELLNSSYPDANASFKSLQLYRLFRKCPVSMMNIMRLPPATDPNVNNHIKV
jgi:hypothetical protein